MSGDLATLDLCTLAGRIRDREISAEEVTSAALARAEALQPPLNAFIRLEAETALEQARTVDARQRFGEVQGRRHGDGSVDWR